MTDKKKRVYRKTKIHIVAKPGTEAYKDEYRRKYYEMIKRRS